MSKKKHLMRVKLLRCFIFLLKFGCIHLQFLIVQLSFCAIQGVMETQLLSEFHSRCQEVNQAHCHFKN